MADEPVRTPAPEAQGVEGLWSIIMSLMRTGAVRLETEADIDGERRVCMASTLHFDGNRLLEIDRRVIDRLDLFEQHRQQVLRQRQRLKRLSALLTYMPWGAMAAGLLGSYAITGHLLTSSAYGVGGLVGMALLRGLVGRIIGLIIRLFGRRLANKFGPSADSTQEDRGQNSILSPP